MTSLLNDDEMIPFAATPDSPFVLGHLPLLGYLYRLSEMQPAPMLLGQKIARQLARRTYRVLRSAGFGGTGIVHLRQPDGHRDLKFNVRNTQFQALYMPQYLPCYEPETTALVEKLVGATGIFFDIGANWGWYSVIEASRPGFTGSVHAFEPNPQSFADLAGIVSQAGLGELIQCHNLALGSREGEARMSIPDGVHSGLSMLDEDGDMLIKLAQLDNLDLPPPNVMKLDVEGHEYDVLLGAQRVIAAARPFLIFENFADSQRPIVTAAPLRLLEEWNYRLYFQAWLAEDGTPYDHVNWVGRAARFALVPFPRLYRGLFENRINIVALPRERTADVKTALAAGPTEA